MKLVGSVLNQGPGSCEQKVRGRKWGNGGSGRKIIYMGLYTHIYIYIGV